MHPLLKKLFKRLKLGKHRPPSKLALALAALDWDKAMALLKGYKALKYASRSSFMTGFFEGLYDAQVLPLHQVCTLPGIPVEIVTLLLRVYPDAIYCTETAFDRIPLHCACRTNADPEIIRAILQAEEDHVTNGPLLQGVSWLCLEPDRLQRVPLHYAVSNGSTAETIDILLHAAPQAAQRTDKRGWTALHVAANAGSSLRVTEAIYRAYPPAIQCRNENACTPVQCIRKTAPGQEPLRNLLKQLQQEYEDEYTNIHHPTRESAESTFEISPLQHETSTVGAEELTAIRQTSSVLVSSQEEPFRATVQQSIAEESCFGSPYDHDRHLPPPAQLKYTHSTADTVASSYYSQQSPYQGGSSADVPDENDGMLMGTTELEMMMQENDEQRDILPVYGSIFV